MSRHHFYSLPFLPLRISFLAVFLFYGITAQAAVTGTWSDALHVADGITTQAADGITTQATVTWRGATSQNKPFSFDVDGGSVKKIELEASSIGCISRFTATITGNLPIINNTFSSNGGNGCPNIWVQGNFKSATEASGSMLLSWNSFCQCSASANFGWTATLGTPTTYSLTVNKSGTGSGMVSGGGNYAAGAAVILTATPDTGSTFAGWSPSPCAASFTMPASALACTATFNTTNSTSTVGLLRNGQWYLDANGNGIWDSCQQNGGRDQCLSFGQPGDMPASGNWDGGSKSYIGVLRSGTGQWFIDRNGNRQWDGCVADGCYSGFGAPGDLPVAGDWHGTGVAKIGVFRNGQWYLDANGNGTWDGCSADLCLSFGQTGDLPVAGNWNGGSQAGVGVFRAGTWYLDYNGNGAWDGCQQDGGQDLCLSFGQAGDMPTAGDWNGNGKAKAGVFRAGAWYLDYNGNGAWDGCGVDRCYVGSFGQAGDLPVAGKW